MGRRILDAAIAHAKSGIADHLTVSIGIVTTSSNSDVQATSVIEAANRLLCDSQLVGCNQVYASLFDPES